MNVTLFFKKLRVMIDFFFCLNYAELKDERLPRLKCTQGLVRARRKIGKIRMHVAKCKEVLIKH